MQAIIQFKYNSTDHTLTSLHVENIKHSNNLVKSFNMYSNCDLIASVIKSLVMSTFYCKKYLL